MAINTENNVRLAQCLNCRTLRRKSILKAVIRDTNLFLFVLSIESLNDPPRNYFAYFEPPPIKKKKKGKIK